MRMLWCGTVLALVAGTATPVLSETPKFILPVDCTLGENCYIQNYVDRDTRDGSASDFMCNGLTYDGHKGTDIALHSRAEIRKGVKILAAASGIVRGVRDGMPDTGITDANPESIAGRECGNGVVIDHGNGWHSQYCHMRRGSVTVSKGERITEGTPIGEVGYSGKTEFAHLHFSLRHNKEVRDPFELSNDETCGAQGENAWQADISYKAGGLITLGFADAVPEFKTIKAGSAGHIALPDSSSALVLWAYAFGVREGDKIALSIEGPKGFSYKHTADLDRNRALYFRAGGKRLTQQSWPIGTYEGTSSLIRDGAVIDTQTTLMEVKAN